MSEVKKGCLELKQPSPKEGIAEVLQNFVDANARGEIVGTNLYTAVEAVRAALAAREGAS